jgi:hypothetical protein
MSADPETMRDVVHDLLTKGAGALLELQELGYAVREISRTLEGLAVATRNFRVDLEKVENPNLVKPIPIVLAVQERVEFVSALAEQIFAAFREFEHGVKSWGLDEAEEGPVSSASKRN